MRIVLVLQLCLFPVCVFAQTPTKTDSSKYTFKCKLIECVPFPPGCGVIAWALVQKYEVLETNYPGYTNKYVLIIQPCPEFIGKEFFKKNHSYKILAATNSGVAFDYLVQNRYKMEKLPMFWCKKIEPINK